MKRTPVKNKTFVLFLTGYEEKITFDDVYDFESAKKEAEHDGNGFRCWLEVTHNNELLVISLD